MIINDVQQIIIKMNMMMLNDCNHDNMKEIMKDFEKMNISEDEKKYLIECIKMLTNKKQCGEKQFNHVIVNIK